MSVADGFDKRKGLDLLKETSKSAPDNWIFVVVGLSDSQIKQLPSNILGLARTNNQNELIQLYSAADVFFNPSLEETFGLVTVEAMACGTPAVVMNSTASPELITTSDAGLIVESGASPASIVDKLKEAMNCKGSRIAAKRFSVERQCSDYYLLYQKLLT